MKTICPKAPGKLGTKRQKVRPRGQLQRQSRGAFQPPLNKMIDFIILFDHRIILQVIPKVQQVRHNRQKCWVEGIIGDACQPKRLQK